MGLEVFCPSLFALIGLINQYADNIQHYNMWGNVPAVLLWPEILAGRHGRDCRLDIFLKKLSS